MLDLKVTVDEASKSPNPPLLKGGNGGILAAIRELRPAVTTKPAQDSLIMAKFDHVIVGVVYI